MSEWWVGAYGPDMNGGAPGITRLRSREDGSLEVDKTVVIELPSPAFLAADHNTIYAALEGSAQVALIDLATLTETGRQSSGGPYPCHIGLYEDTVVVANYGDGSVAVLGGEILSAEGSGPHPAQDGPHAHSSLELEPGIIVSADLGADRIHVHSLADGVLARLHSLELPAGTGPRDLLLHPSGLLYVLGEHSSSIIVLDWRLGELLFVDSFGLPGALEGDQAAGLVISHEGIVYALLRGSNRVSVLGSSEDGRALERLGSVSSEGDWPRHLALDGQILHVANQLSGSIASFALDAESLPVLIAPPIAVPSPTYLLEV